MRVAWFIVCVAIAGSVARPVSAQAPTAAERWFYSQAKSNGLLDAPKAMLEHVALRWFHSSDVDGSGAIDTVDRTIFFRFHLARQRADRIAAMLRFDLDGDDIVTAAEVESALMPRYTAFHAEPLGNQRQRQASGLRDIDLRKGVAAIMAADADGDRRLTFEEMARAATLAAKTDVENRQRQGPLDGEPMPPLAEGAGAVTAEDYAAFVTRLLAAYDVNADGNIDDVERIAMARRMQDDATVKTLEQRNVRSR